MRTFTGIKWALAGVVLLAGIALAGAASAQQPTPSDDQVNAIARQLYCPVCENVPLDVCPTEACARWRATIRQQLAEGWTEAQIKDYFVQQYGARVLDEPPARGLNWLVYLLPPLIFLIGAFILVRAMRSWRRSPAPEAGAGPAPVDDPYAARLEDELRQRD
jgi:cytochrome c-type biogenesis protein CcmH